MNLTTVLKDIIKPLFVVFGVIYVLHEYRKQQKFGTESLIYV
jgi:hypothetical protein